MRVTADGAEMESEVKARTEVELDVPLDLPACLHPYIFDR